MEHHCGERTRVNTCINKSLVLALESYPSSDVTPPAVLPTFFCGNSKSAGLASA